MKLLVLSPVDYPNLGLQISGGTIEEDESPKEATLREGLEETSSLTAQTTSGDQTRLMLCFVASWSEAAQWKQQTCWNCWLPTLRVPSWSSERCRTLRLGSQSLPTLEVAR